MDEIDLNPVCNLNFDLKNVDKIIIFYKEKEFVLDARKIEKFLLELV